VLGVLEIHKIGSRRWRWCSLGSKNHPWEPKVARRNQLSLLWNNLL